MSKKLFLVLFSIFTCYSVHSQVEHAPVPTLAVRDLLPPESVSHEDLAFLKKDLRNKRILMLGERTHMYGNIFTMKARIVEFLHEELGYTTIAIESPMYDLWKMNLEHEEFSPRAFNNNIWGAWSGSEEFQRLVKYIDENGLKVIGFDSQVNEVEEFIEDFFRYMDSRDIKMKIDEDDLAIALEEILVEVTFEEEDIRFKTFEKEFKRLISKLETRSPKEEEFYWLQVTKGILATAKDAYHNQNIQSNFLGDEDYNFRDAQMADNLIQYSRRYPEEKIIVWADNIHVVKDISSVQDSIISDFEPMGAHIKAALGEEVFSLATFHVNDSLLEREKLWHATPIREGSFEDQVQKIGSPFLYISSGQEAMQEPQWTRMLNFRDFSKARLDQMFDGYVYLAEATPSRKRIGSEESKAAQTEIDSNRVLLANAASEREERIEKIQKTQQIGRNLREITFIDTETLEPVPYATLALKEHDIYRISDTNGKIEIPSHTDFTPQSAISISSLGYTSLHLTWEELQDTLYFTPSFEQLDAVALTAYNTTPKKVLKQVIKNLEDNYPEEALNYERYVHFRYTQNDTLFEDIETLTFEHNEGYFQNRPENHLVIQVKRNKDLRKEPRRFTNGIIPFRGNPIQFASVLHKRKSKKFDLEFVVPKASEEKELYIIKFATNRDRFGYTDRWYPTRYSGEIYIRKDDYAVVEIREQRETTIPEDKMEKYEYWLGRFKEKMILKDELITHFQKKEDGRYYVSEQLERKHVETTGLEGKFVNAVLEGRSYLYDYSNTDVTELFYEDIKVDSALDRVEYDEGLWEEFYGEHGEKMEHNSDRNIL